MHEYYKILDNLECDAIRNYLRNTFVPKYVDTQIGDNRYVPFTVAYMKDELKTFEESLLRYNFPKIAYFLVFVHYDEQPIHIDGYTEEIRWASLNLPIEGYEGTKLNFYESNGDLAQTKSDARYMTDRSALTLVDTLESDKWVIVNSGVPHNVVDVDPKQRRVTICFRFEGNPKFEDLIRNL